MPFSSVFEVDENINLKIYIYPFQYLLNSIAILNHLSINNFLE